MDGLKELTKIFTQISDEKEMTSFLKEILTEKELDTLSDRWLLMKEIHGNVSQRKIAEKFHMSLCKITRGAKVLKRKNSVSKKILDQNLNRDY